MHYPATYPHTVAWLPSLRTWVEQWLTRLTPTPAQQVLLPAGDSYHLAADVYYVQVLAGRVWLPEIGLYAAGERVALTVGAAGLALHSYAQQPAVLAVRVDG